MTVHGYRLAIDISGYGDYSGPYDDVTSDLLDESTLEFSFGRGRPSADAAAVAGQMSFALRNETQRYSLENPASPLYGLMLPGRKVQFAYGATPLIEGVIDDFDVDPDAAAKDFSVTVLDGWGRPGGEKLSTAVFQGQRTGDLMNVVLDAVGWPTGPYRSVDPGATVVPYWWLEDVDAATAVGDLVASEGQPAIAYVAGGVFTFRDRHHRLLDAASLYSQGTYTHLSPSGMWVSTVDPFSRTVASGWGSTPDGLVWSTSGGVASDFNVGSGVGTQSHSATNVSRRAWLASVTSEQIQATISVPAVALGAPLRAAVTLRNLDPVNDHYRAQVNFDLLGVMSLSLVERVGGGDSTLASVTLADTYAAGTPVIVKARVDGQTLRAKAWLAGAAEPGWQLFANDATIGSGYPPGVRTVVSTGSTNTLPLVFSVDDVIVTPTDDKILKGSYRYNHGQKDVINAATLDVAPRLPTDREVVWSTDAPIALGAGESAVYLIQASDPFVDLQTPATGVGTYLYNDRIYTDDYNAAQGSATFALSRTSGQSAQLTITAGGGGVFLDGGVRVRGTPLQQAPTRKVTAAYGAADQAWDGSAPWAYYYDAQVLVDRIVTAYSLPRPSVTLDVEGALSSATLTRILGTAISDRVTIRNDDTGMNADFHVEQVAHKVRKFGVRHTQTIGAQIAEQVQAGNPFAFDTAGKGFDQGQFALAVGNNPASMFLFDTSSGSTQGFGNGGFAA